MRLIHRQRQNHQKRTRIAISEAEISADLHYPAQQRQARPTAGRRMGAR